MSRGEIGARPLLVGIIKRVISYIRNIKGRTHTIAYSAYNFETKNNIIPNFYNYIRKFDFYTDQKSNVDIICQHNYERLWVVNIKDSPKAISYALFKNTVFFEKYLYDVKNRKSKIALTRFRLSNHNLLIEKRRHMRPKLDRTERKCFLCKDVIEDEKHFITNCPLYSKHRAILYHSLQNNSIYFTSLTGEDKFIFIMINENINVTGQIHIQRFCNKR